MAAAYTYSNTAVETTLSGNITSGATSVTVEEVTGYPTTYPFIIAIDYGASGEELVKVTGASSTTFTVERGFGGTSASSHSLGAVVRHVYNAQDAADFRTHEQDGSAVHGLTGDVVGTSDSQTLSNKTLTAPTVNAGALAGTFTGSPTLDGEPAFSGDPAFTGNPTFTGGPVFTATAAAASFEAASDTNLVLQAQVTGDAEPRFQLGADGIMAWGPGDAAGDVTLERESEGRLLVNGRILFDRGIDPESDILQSRLTGDAGLRYLVEADGDMYWGDGTSLTLDTSLRRPAADTLTAGAKFSATVETSSTFTTASGFSLIESRLRKTCGVVTAAVYVNVTTTIPVTSTSSGNIVDTPLGTLPSGYRPTDPMEAMWSTGIEHGDALIGSDGVIQLRTSTYNQAINSGTNLRVSATYVQ